MRTIFMLVVGYIVGVATVILDPPAEGLNCPVTTEVTE